MNGASVTFLGGMDVPLTLLEKAPASETRVRDEIRDKIYKIDLRKAGVKQIGDLRNVGAGALAAGMDGSIHRQRAPPHLPLAERYDGADG